MNKFAKRLKELRLELKLSQRDLAKKTGISQTSISAYELNKIAATVDVIITLCLFFQVSAGYLIGLED